MCHQGVWFAGTSASGPWEVTGSVPKEIYQIPMSSPSHHVTYVTVEEDDDDDWVVYAAAAGYTGMMFGWGCTMWGSGWYLSAVHRVWWLLSVLLPAFPDLRVLRLVQPVYGRLRAERGGLRSLRRRRRRRPLQPANRDLRTRRGRLWPVRRSRSRAGVQPPYRHLRGDAPGIERVRKLGLDGGAARRRLGQDQPLHEQTDRQHHADDQDRRRVGGDSARRGRRPRRRG